MNDKRLHRNADSVKKGDVFVTTTSTSIADVDGDSVNDFTLEHDTLKNGKHFVECKITWYGLDEVGVQAIEQSFTKAGIEEGEKTVTGFKAVVQEWEKFTQGLKHLNEAGHAVADALK